MSATLTRAVLHYGISSYPMNGFPIRQVPFAPLAGAVLDQVVEAVAHHTGCLTPASVRSRITHNLAIDEQTFDLPTGKLTIPARVCFIGNGFSVTWEKRT